MYSKESDFFALDLGSNKIVALAANLDSNHVTGYTINYSEGLRAGTIIDIQKAETAINNAIYSLEKICNQNIQRASISISGVDVKSIYVDQKIQLTNNQVTKKDINEVINLGLNQIKNNQQDVIHYFPLSFELDHKKNIINPVGMIGKELGCRIHLVTINSSLLLNLINCLAKCQVEVDNVILGTYASGLMALTEDERNLGSLIIDLGAYSTSFGIFLDNKLMYNNHLPIGSAYISSDIAKAFSINFSTAEKLKVLYGKSINTEENISINLDDLESEQGQFYNTILRSKDLNQVIIPRVEEIIEMIKAEYDNLGFDQLISRKIVITGGGSLLTGIDDTISSIFGKQVRIADVKGVSGFNESFNSNIYTVALGMLKYQNLNSPTGTSNIINDSQNRNNGFWSKVTKWIKQTL